MIVGISTEPSPYMEPVRELFPLDDPLFVAFLKDYKAYKPFVDAFTTSKEDREKWNLQIRYQEQYISGSFLWNKFPLRRWDSLNDIWVKMAAVYRESMSTLNQEIQKENVSENN